MKKILSSITVLLFLFFASCDNKIKKIDYELTSQELYKEFQENEVAALAKYKGKHLKVYGYLVTFRNTLGSNYCDIGSPGDIFGEVSVEMSDEFSKRAGNFKKGDYMWVDGICTGTDLTGRIELE